MDPKIHASIATVLIFKSFNTSFAAFHFRLTKAGGGIKRRHSPTHIKTFCDVKREIVIHN